MRGDLRQSSLAEVLRQLYAERKSGILHISRQNIRKRIHLKDGVAIFADAGDGEPLSRDQAEVLAFSLFTWTSGELAFEQGEPEIDETHAFDRSPSWLILEASRRIDDVETLERLLGGPDVVFSCTKTTVLPVFTMRLSPAENAILTFARECEQFTAADLPLPAGDVAVLSALNALLAVGLLEIVEKKAAPESVPPPTTAPTPPPPPSPVAESVPTEMEELLDTLEASRTGIVPPKSNPADPPPPEEMPAPDAPESSTADDAAPEPRAEEPDVPPLRPRPSWMEVVHTWRGKVVELFPDGKSRLVAAGSAALVGVAVALVLVLTSGDDEGSHSEPVVVADSTRPAEPPPPAPSAEPEPEPEPEPSEAELFYQANLAFENGDYEESKSHLTELLELQPDLDAARELMTQVERELAPKPDPPEPKPPPKPVPETELEPEPEPESVSPPPPTTAALFADARAAFNRGELELSQTTLEELRAVDASHPGVERLERQLADRFWERKLPLAFSARHDHALGGCDGVLTLTEKGYGYRSEEHEWFWSFQDVAETERRDAERLRLETREGKSYNFELREPLTEDDWSRYHRLTSR